MSNYLCGLFSVRLKSEEIRIRRLSHQNPNRNTSGANSCLGFLKFREGKAATYLFDEHEKYRHNQTEKGGDVIPLKRLSLEQERDDNREHGQ